MTDSALQDSVHAALEAAESGDKAPVVEIKVSVPANAQSLTLTIPTQSLTALSADSDASLSVASSVGSIALDASAMASVADQAADGKVTLSIAPVAAAELSAQQQAAVGTAPVYELTLMSGDTVLSDFHGGTATVTLPYQLTAGQEAAGVVVRYLRDDGTTAVCPTTYDSEASAATFTTGHFSKYVVAYDEARTWNNPFADVAESDWFYSAVYYVHTNGLMTGYNETAFGPDNDLSRAQLAQILYNLEQQPAVTAASAFTDVSESDWFCSAVLWAAQNHIVNGVEEGTFAPNANVSREQLAVMLYRYAGSPETTGSLDAFADAGAVSDYAAAAMAWAVEQGLITGMSDGSLHPQGNATRAQVATILMRYCEAVAQ